MQKITIFQLLEWLKKNDYNTSFYDDSVHKEDFLHFLYFFRKGNVWATDGLNEWLFIEFV